MAAALVTFLDESRLECLGDGHASVALDEHPESRFDITSVSEVFDALQLTCAYTERT